MTKKKKKKAKGFIKSGSQWKILELFKKKKLKKNCTWAIWAI
jgi:hypothetical protein